MVKLLGAALLAGAGLTAGLGMTRERLARVKALEAWAAALELWGRELAYRLPDTPELLGRLAEVGPAGVRQVFFAALQGLESLGEKDFSAVWREALAQYGQNLADDDITLLGELGEVLGRYGWEDQRRAVEQTAVQLTGRAGKLRTALSREGRSYVALGLSAGTAAAILLL